MSVSVSGLKNKYKKKRVECEKCKQTFSKREYLVRHLWKFHGIEIPLSTRKAAPKPTEDDPRPFKCDQCPKSYLKQKHLARHKKTHLLTFCGLCNENVTYYTTHMRSVHAQEVEKPFECYLCKRMFYKSIHLEMHMKSHISDGNTYVCELCSKEFYHAVTFRNHRKMHTRKRRRPTMCICCICGKELSLRTLKTHMMIHSGVKPHQCPHCEQTFRTKGTMIIHIRTHTQDKPYKCKFCEKGFKDASTMRVHLRCHTGENPYICHLCGRRTKQSQNLKSHFKHFHKNTEITGKQIRANSRIFARFTEQELQETLLRDGDLINLLNQGLKDLQKEELEKEQVIQNERLAATDKSSINVSETTSGREPSLIAQNQNDECETSQNISYSDDDDDAASADLSNNTPIKIESVFSLSESLTLKQEKNDGPVCTNNSTRDAEGDECETNTEADQNNLSHFKPEIEMISFDIPPEYESDGEKMVAKEEISQATVQIKKEQDNEMDANSDLDYFGNDAADMWDGEDEIVKTEEGDDKELLIVSSIESNRQTIICDICEKPFTTRAHMVRHCRNIHKMIPPSRIAKPSLKPTPDNPRPYKCDLCGKTYGRYNHLSRHQKETHKPVFCELCNQWTNWYKEHMQTAHRPPVKKEDSINDKTAKGRKKGESSKAKEKREKCSMCNKKYSLKHWLANHSGDRPYECYLCHKSYKTRSILQEHMSAYHIGDTACVCDVCGLIFPVITKLRKHFVYKHTTARPYQCDLCPRTFKLLNGLKIHRRTHTGEKPYTCKICSASFAVATTLKLHERRHTGVKPYACPYCGKSFSDSSTHRQHVRLHTGEKPYQCKLCDRRTTQPSNLKSHYRHYHKIIVKNVSMFDEQ